MSKYQPIIGLEVHVQLNTKSKMFCGCSAEIFGKESNSQVCPVCLGLPGAIPSPPNIEAIKKAVLVAKALKCRLAKGCRFERKSYFYPDLPKGFQISQYKTAIGVGGEFEGIRITRVHLEEDAGKLIHDGGQTFVDLNRAGVPLLEIVTEPDVRSSDQAKSALKELRAVLRHLKVSDADMEKGSMRLEANISLREVKGQRSKVKGKLRKGSVVGQEPIESPNYKVELKNINSFNFLGRALEIEIERQQKILVKGKKVIQETRGYDEEGNETYSQRKKEEASDYRYFPEPDLPPVTGKLLKHEGKIILPAEQRADFEKKYRLPQQYSTVLASDPELLALFKDTLQEVKGSSPKEVANAVVNRRFGDPKKLGIRGLAKAIRMGKKKAQLSSSEMGSVIDKAILDNPRAVEDYKAGKAAALQFLLGMVMRESKGKVDPNEARELLKKKIS